MRPSRYALRKQCRVLRNLECWIPDIRQAEQVLRAARYDKKDRATSWAFLAISPTLGGPK